LLETTKQRKLFFDLSKDESATRKGVEARPYDDDHRKIKTALTVEPIRLVSSLCDVANIYLVAPTTMLIQFQDVIM